MNDSGISKLSVLVAALVGIAGSCGHSCGSGLCSQWWQWWLVVAWASCGGGGGSGCGCYGAGKCCGHCAVMVAAWMTVAGCGWQLFVCFCWWLVALARVGGGGGGCGCKAGVGLVVIFCCDCGGSWGGSFVVNVAYGCYCIWGLAVECRCIGCSGKGCWR